MIVRNVTDSILEINDLGISLEIGDNDLYHIPAYDLKTSSDLIALIENDSIVVLDENNSILPKDIVLDNFSKGHLHTWDEILEKPEDFTPSSHDHPEYATHDEIDSRIQAIVDSAPEALDTLNEIATRLENDQDAIDSITDELSRKSDVDHTHDGRYYLKSDVDTLLNNKSNVGHTHPDTYYSKNEINSFLDNKANSDHVHSYSEISDRPSDDNFNQLPVVTTTTNSDYIPIYSLITNSYNRIKKSDFLGASQNIIDLTYAHLQYRVGKDEYGGTFTAGGWRTRPLNTIVSNDIENLLLEDNTIFLPSGVYWIRAFAMSCGVRDNVLGITDASNLDEPLLVGMRGSGGWWSWDNKIAYCSGVLVFTNDRKIQIVHICQQTQYRYGMGIRFRWDGYPLDFNVFADVEIWRIS